MTTPNEADDAFEPSAEAETALSSTAFEGTNVCRAAALSSLLQEATVAMGALSAEQRSLGFSEEIIERGGRAWREFDVFDGQTDLTLSPDGDPDAARIRRWIELNETASPRSAVSFLVAILGSGLERESAGSRRCSVAWPQSAERAVATTGAAPMADLRPAHAGLR